VPWNAAGDGPPAAHTVHTLHKELPGVGNAPRAPGDVDETVELTGKHNDHGDLVNQLVPGGVFDAPGEDVGIEPAAAPPAAGQPPLAVVPSRVTRSKSLATWPPSDGGDEGVGAIGWVDFIARRP
jgi:hypothetical protein